VSLPGQTMRDPYRPLFPVEKLYGWGIYVKGIVAQVPRDDLNPDPDPFTVWPFELMSLVTVIYAAVSILIFWRSSNDRVALFAPLMLVTFGGAAFDGTMKLLPSVNSAW
jgi:hypothetical protein